MIPSTYMNSMYTCTCIRTRDMCLFAVLSAKQVKHIVYRKASCFQNCSHFVWGAGIDSRPEAAGGCVRTSDVGLGYCAASVARAVTSDNKCSVCLVACDLPGILIMVIWMDVYMILFFFFYKKHTWSIRYAL